MLPQKKSLTLMHYLIYDADISNAHMMMMMMMMNCSYVMTDQKKGTYFYFQLGK